MSDSDKIHPSSESDLSNTEQPSRPSNLYRAQSNQASTPASRATGSPLTDTASDQDADGDEDGDYDIETPPITATTAPAEELSPSSSSARVSKRKMSATEDEYMRENPELYGLRRSGRARPSRRLVESSSEDESDAPRRKKRKQEHPSKTSARATPIQDFSQELDSESDNYIASRRHAAASKKRNRLQNNGTLAPPPQRFSERRTTKVTNYNEENDESEEEIATPNNWAWGNDTTAGIETVMDARLKEGLENKDIPNKYDYEFWIKWQGQAHYHSTWETWDSLSQYQGYRRLENFWRAFRDAQEKLNDPDFPAEDKEQWCIEREDKLDAYRKCMNVDRVIDVRDGEDETEYYILWDGCEYLGATWESASLISEIAQDEIDRYIDRTSQMPVTNQNELRFRTRTPYRRFREQPSYIKHGQLRDFQIEGVNFLAYSWCKDDNVILADEMGLGKTVQTIAFINWLRHDRGQQGPFLVVVPLSTLPAWADTFNKWAPDINYVKYTGIPDSRAIIQDKELFANGNNRKYKFHVLLTTYEYVIKDQAFLSSLKWQFLFVDEAHRLKNRKSELYSILMNFGIPNSLLITGTPMQNNYTELAALMNFLKPGQGDVADEVNLDSATAAQNLAQLRNALDPLIMRRTKNKVEKDLPPKSEKIIRIALSDYQLEYYKNILAKNYTALNQGGKGEKTSLLNISMQLKKASNHAFLFPSAEERRMETVDRDDRKEVLKTLITCSGKMMVLEKLLTKLKAEGHRVLIFSQMVNMLNILSEYCVLKGEKFQRLDGTITSAARAQAIDHFNASDSQDFIFLLSTRAGGLGINLTAADTIIIWDSDWNPQADLQAMSRAHRIGQSKPVQVYRFVSKDTLEEDILERARNKMILEYLTIQQGITDKNSDALDRVAKKVGEPEIDDINRLLKRRGQRMFTQTGNQQELESMDIDAVIASAEEHKTEQAEGFGAGGGEDFLRSFEYTDVKADLEWDDIIPEDQIREVKAQAKKEEEDRMTRELLLSAAPRKRKGPVDGHGERDQRAAKKQARAAAAAAAEDESDDDSDTDRDPKRPLSEREVRNLVRAYEKYGSIDDCRDAFLRDAKLIGRDIDVLKGALSEITSKADQLMREDQDRLKALEQEANKPLTKKERKAILFDHRGVKRLNAETITQRPIEMRMMRDVVASAPDWRSFRVPEATKAAQYTCTWGAREDGMLCVGIARHGYGAWVAIRDDSELGMGDKFFLEEHRVDKKAEREGAEDKHAKSPGAVHLVRRANYLIQVLKDKTSGGTNIAVKKQLENHHRNNKKHPGLLKHRSEKSVTASPGPTAMRKVSSSDQVQRARGLSHGDARQHAFSAHADKKGTPDRKVNGHHAAAGTPDRKRKAEDDTDDVRKPRPKHARSDEQLNAIKIHKHPHVKKERSSDVLGSGPHHRRASSPQAAAAAAVAHKKRSSHKPAPTTSSSTSGSHHRHHAHPHPPRKSEDQVAAAAGTKQRRRFTEDEEAQVLRFRNRADNFEKLKALRGLSSAPSAELARLLVPAMIDVGLAVQEEARRVRAEGAGEMVYWDWVAQRYWPKPDAKFDGARLKAQHEKYLGRRQEQQKRDAAGEQERGKDSSSAPKPTNGVQVNGGA